MNLATGFIAQTLQAHDELLAARINEQRRVSVERRDEEGGRAVGRSSLLQVLSDRLLGRGSSAGTRGTGAGGHAQGLRAAH